MTNSQKNTITYGVILAVIIAAFFVGNCHGIKSVTKNTGSDTIVTPHVDTSHSIPVPFKIIHDTIPKDHYIKGNTVYLHDTLPGEIITSTANDYIAPTTCDSLAELLSQKVVYKDSQQGKTWKATVIDTVSGNRLRPRTWVVTTYDSLIHTTTVLTKPRNFVFYVVGSVMGNRQYPIGGGGAGMALKLPNDKTYMVQIKTSVHNKPMIEATYLLPIK